MNSIIFTWISLLIGYTSMTVSLTYQNDYPIVLVHGFLGWGRNEMMGMKYWGGLQGDFQEILRKKGHKVYTVAVGPVSSNWDRACELYAQIKGGKVDYGQEHAKKFSHKRYGRTYPGLYKEWGTKDANGNRRKIHLIGHSMGGQTIRMLTQLLHSGSKGSGVNELSTSTLFEGGHSDWVSSITSISTPHEGTLIADAFSVIGNTVKKLIAGVLSIGGVIGDIGNAVYDFKLDQWSLQPRQNGETLQSYFNRVFNSHMFKNGFKDISLWDLSTSGSREANNWVKTLPHIYYYSYGTEDTYKSKKLHNWKFRTVYKPNTFSMLWPLQPISFYLGGVETSDAGYSEEWQKNDGVVNSASMKGTGKIVNFKSSKVHRTGIWHFMPWLNRIDHLSICGWTILKKMTPVFENHVRLLRTLPKSSSRRVLKEADSNLIKDIEYGINDFVMESKKLKSKKDLEGLCASATEPLIKSYCRFALKENRRLRGTQ